MICRDGASRMSSVCGLKASPQRAMVFAVNVAAIVHAQFFDERPLLLAVDIQCWREQLKGIPGRLGDMPQRPHVFWEAAAAEADARVEKCMPDATVGTHGLAQLINV